MLQSPEIQEAAKQGMIDGLRRWSLDTALRIREKFIPEEMAESPEVQAAAKEGVIYQLEARGTATAIEIIEKFNLPAEIIQDSQIQALAKELMLGLIKDARTDGIRKCLNRAKEIKRAFNLPDETGQAEAKEELLTLLKSDFFYEDKVLNLAFFFKENFNLPDDVVQTVAKEGVIYWLRGAFYDFKPVREIKEAFNLSDEIVRAAAQELINKSLRSGAIKFALRVKKEFISK